MAGWTGGCGRVVNVRRFAYMRDMAKGSRKTTVVLVDGPLDPGKPSRAKYRTAERDGKRVRLRVVDADGPRFTADLHATFAANVRRARDENRALDGD
jgi:hypothetical protein